MTQLLAELVSMLAFPGALSMLAIGLGAELVAARALSAGPGFKAPAALRASLRPGAGSRALPPLAGAGALLAMLAVTQVAVPLNPLPAPDRNLVVAMVALAACSWLTWTWGWQRGQTDARLLLLVQFGWLVALLAPAAVPQNLRPQVLGAVLVPALLPLKLASALLYLLCLPPLLQLLPESAPQGLPGASDPEPIGLEKAGFRVLRILLWLPYCGLFASLYLPPPGDDAAGMVRFVLSTFAAAAVAIFLATALRRRFRGGAATVYLRAVGPFALFTVGVALMTSLLVAHHI